MMAVRRSLAWMASGQAAFMIFQFVGSIAVARLLGPYNTGIFAIALAVVGFVGVIQSLGLNELLVRERELTRDIVATAFTINFAIALAMALVIAGVGLLGGALFREAGVRHILLVIAVVPIVGTLAFVPQAMLHREGDFRLLAIVRAGSTGLSVALTVVLALLGYNYMSFAYSQVATALATNILINVIARRHVSFRMSLADWPRIVRFGTQMLAISGVSQISTRVTELVLGRTLGIAALGLFSRASSNHNMLWDSVHGITSRIVFSNFAGLVRNGIPLRARYLRVLELMTGLLWPLFAGVAVLAGPMVSLVYGAAWVGAGRPLALLCVASIGYVSTTMVWEVFVVRDETARQVRFEFIRAIVGTLLFIAGCFVSLEAAAASRIADALFAQFLYRPHLQRMTGTASHEFKIVYSRSAVCAAAAIAPALTLMIAQGFSTRIPVEQVAGAVLAGIALWFVALRLIRHQLHAELLTVFQRLQSARFAQ